METKIAWTADDRTKAHGVPEPDLLDQALKTQYKSLLDCVFYNFGKTNYAYPCASLKTQSGHGPCHSVLPDTQQIQYCASLQFTSCVRASCTDYLYAWGVWACVCPVTHLRVKRPSIVGCIQCVRYELKEFDIRPMNTTFKLLLIAGNTNEAMCIQSLIGSELTDSTRSVVDWEVCSSIVYFGKKSPDVSIGLLLLKFIKGSNWFTLADMYPGGKSLDQGKLHWPPMARLAKNFRSSKGDSSTALKRTNSLQSQT